MRFSQYAEFAPFRCSTFVVFSHLLLLLPLFLCWLQAGAQKRCKASCNKTDDIMPNPANLQECLQRCLYILCALFYNAQHHLRILISVRHYCDADRTWRPQVHLEIWIARDIPVQASCKTMSIVSWSHSLQDMTCKATFDAWPDRCNNALRGWGKHMNMLTNPVVDGNRWHHRQAQA